MRKSNLLSFMKTLCRGEGKVCMTRCEVAFFIEVSKKKFLFAGVVQEKRNTEN